MKYMDVWPDGKILLDNWSSYWSFQTGRSNKHCNILSWLKGVPLFLGADVKILDQTTKS